MKLTIVKELSLGGIAGVGFLSSFSPSNSEVCVVIKRI